MESVPVERRTYYPLPHLAPGEGRPCPGCGRQTMTPWYLRRDQQRRVWRRWVCVTCQAHQDLAEEESA